MSIMTKVPVVLAALLAGFCGGVIARLAIPGREPAGGAPVIRARSFEITDADGTPISYWGVDDANNAVLAFGARPGQTASGGHRSHVGPRAFENQIAAIGLQGNDMPIMEFNGTDRKPRVRILLDMFGKPALVMDDEIEPRVLLGVEQSDTPGPNANVWVLAFRPERARIGMSSETRGGLRYVKGFLYIPKDEVEFPPRALLK
jgi:hypothetical protein